MAHYTFTDGTPYEGPTINMPDGRILSGATYMPTSRRVVEVKDGSKRSGELHEADNAKEFIPEDKVGKQRRGKRSVVRKKSSNVGKAIQS
tara:strand:- start:446 stop:715 length:270 start_codon:yes stop_codon:yes gene_type:complete